MGKISKNRSAFSLIEIAIIIVVISIVGGLTLGLAPSGEDSDAEMITKQNLDEIEAAILAFYNQNGFLPCPATFNGTGAAAADSTNCATTPVSGVTDIDSDPNRLRIGTVPGKDINLSQNKLIDGWNNRIIYAVPAELSINTTRFNAYTNTSSAIRIVDTDGISLEDGNVAFVLFSPGQNRKGAFSARGSTSFTAINLCSGSGNDLENCDGDDLFRKSFLDLSAGSTYYDDLLIYTTLTRVSEIGNYSFGGAGVNDNFYALFDESSPNTNEPKTFSGFDQLSYSTTMSDNIGITATTSGSVPNQTTSFTIPAGKYLVRANTQTCGLDVNYVLYWGPSGDAGGSLPNDSNSTTSPSYCSRTVGLTVLEFNTPSSLFIYSYSAIANATDGHGRVHPTDTFYPKAFRDVEFWKLD